MIKWKHTHGLYKIWALNQNVHYTGHLCPSSCSVYCTKQEEIFLFFCALSYVQPAVKFINMYHIYATVFIPMFNLIHLSSVKLITVLSNTSSAESISVTFCVFNMVSSDSTSVTFLAYQKVISWIHICHVLVSLASTGWIHSYRVVAALTSHHVTTFLSRFSRQLN